MTRFNARPVMTAALLPSFFLGMVSACRGVLAMLICGLTLLAPAALAAQGAPTAGDALVTDVQMPAWLERRGEREPLVPATVLRTGDAVVTGRDGRVRIRLPEGSVVRLGESGRLVLSDLRVSRGGTTVLSGLLEVAQGAFRFTTSALARARSERNLQIRIATVTAGIRGTDLWGRGNAQREIVCLIEGRITVTRGAEPPVAMSEPLSFYIAPVGAPAMPVAQVDQKQLDEWVRETELAPGAGAVAAGGRWQVTTLSTDSQDEALAAWDALRNAGFAARIRPTRSQTGVRYAVQVAGIISEREARGLAARLAGVPGVTGQPMVGR
jgi:hypothetical protein